LSTATWGPVFRVQTTPLLKLSLFVGKKRLKTLYYACQDSSWRSLCKEKWWRL